MKKYEDMLDLPAHISKIHPQMSRYDRAAQFAPFAALIGYEAAINETGRFVEQKKELDELEKEIINAKLNQIINLSIKKPVKIIYFVPDKIKQGGFYKAIEGIIKKYDIIERKIVLESKEIILIDDIISLIGEGLEVYENNGV